jgi:putative ABC transport system permease protein
MFKHHLTVFYRNLLKSKSVSGINILGLALGMAACMLILGFVQFETSYDAHFTNSDNIYRLVWKYGADRYTERLQPIAGEMAQSEIADITKSLRLFKQDGSVNILEDKEKAFFEDHILYADHTFFDLFDYRLMAKQQASFREPYSAILSTETAAKYFGEGDAVGKMIAVSNMFGTTTYTIRDVVAEMTANSSVSFDVLLSNEKLFSSEMSYFGIQDWGAFETYILVNETANATSLEHTLNSLVRKQRPEGEETIVLQSLKDIHLYSGYIEGGRDKVVVVVIFSAIAVTILMLAWFNSINLNTAKAFERTKEIGIKKVFGSPKKLLISQFLIESLLTNVLALVAALILHQFLSDIIADITGVKMAVLESWDSLLILAFVAVVALGSSVASLIPGFLMSGFPTTSIVAGKAKYSGHGKLLRRVLVGLQFGVSAVLILVTLTIDRQIQYMVSSEKGLKTDNLLIVAVPRWQGDGFEARLEAFNGSLKKASWFEGISTSSSVPGVGFNYGTSAKLPEADEESAIEISVAQVDDGFARHYNIPLLAGRFFDADVNNDGKVVVNEATIEHLNIPLSNSFIGRKIDIGGELCEIVGVLQNYNHRSMHEPIVPIAYRYAAFGNTFSIALQDEHVDESLDYIRQAYMTHFPGNPFDYHFLDDIYKNHYLTDRQVGNLGLVFTVFALAIATLGLFGFTSLIATQKTKEIGIRKVLGASSRNIFYKLSLEFIVLVGVSSILFLPLGLYISELWITEFSFRFSPSPLLFLTPLIVLLLVAVLALSYHTIRAAYTKPVDALRYE